MEKKAGGGGVLMRRYEMGRLLGQGTFAKVYHARSLATGRSVAIKVIDKEKVLRVGMIDQIKREISVMRLVRHPNVVQLYEVMASKTKIYFAMEYVRGGELFSKIARGRLQEDVARRYFQQLISAVDFCHSRGVYHRDLKPENLLLDENGDLKITDFGLSALADTRRHDGLLHTTCGTPAYVAPEVITKRGYDGPKADIWSCGVILFVLLAGYLPFHDTNLMEMYRRIGKADFRCPNWFPSEVRKLISRLLDPNPSTRITIPKLHESLWFKKGFKPIDAQHDAAHVPADVAHVPADVNAAHVPADVNAAFNRSSSDGKLTSLNAFDIISLASGFNLSGLFEGCGQSEAAEARFTTQKPAAEIFSRLEEIAETGSFSVRKKDGKVNLQGRKEGRKGQLGIDAEIFEVTPSFHVVELKKSSGDTLEYQQFCDQGLKPSLQDIIWTWQKGGMAEHQNFSGEFSVSGVTAGTSPPIAATSA